MPNTDKTILLPQLQRYDQKIKGWADNKFLTKTDTPSLPKATATTLGGVKVGYGLNVTDDGILSAEDDIVFTWDFDTSAFSCNKTFEEVKKIITTGVRRTATANGLLENFSITLLAEAANDNVVMFFGTAPGDALGSGMLGSRTNETITYLFQKGLAIIYTPDGHIQMTEDLSNLNTNMSFDFKNTTFQYDQYNSFDLKDDGITSAKLANGAVTAAKLASGAVTEKKIADGAITRAKIADSAVSSIKIAPSAVTRTKIADDAIESHNIADGQITVSKIKDGSVTSAKLALGAVDTDNIKEGAIEAVNIRDGGVTSAKLADGAVTVTKLASGSVNEDGIADGAITRAKIADGAVNATKLWSGAVHTDKILDSAVTSAKLADSAVTSTKIADGAITADKLASDVGVGGSIAEATEKTSGVVYAKVNPRMPPKSLGHVYSLQNSGLHIESFNKGVINTEHLANYAVTAGKVANNAINAAKLANNAVTTNKIVNGAVTATKLASGAVTADNIADGAITADKLASGVGGLKAGSATILNGSKHSFGLWSVAVPEPPGSTSKSFTINVFYNSNILIISDVQCYPSSVVSMTIEHSKVDKSGINRSGYIAFESSSAMYDSIKLAGQGINIFETDEAGSIFCFAGLFFTV